MAESGGKQWGKRETGDCEAMGTKGEGHGKGV